jgi:hypothetical protein
MSDLETVKVKNGDDYAIINKADFDPDKHEPFDDESKAAISDTGSDGLTDDERAQLSMLEAKRTAQANRGTTASEPASADDQGKNPSGTFSTPTPTDIRFPDKQATEFENNQGAFIGKSAADLREDMGLPDAPGGIKPPVDIPADWQSMHWKQQVSLAKQITGSADDVTATQAGEIITAEVAARAAADPAAPAAPAA